MTLKEPAIKYALESRNILTGLFLTTILAIIVITGCSNQPASGESYQSQMEMVQKSNDLMNKLDWTAYADLTDSASLEEFREILIPGIQTLVMATQEDSVNLFGKYYQSEFLQSVPSDSFFVTIMSLATELVPELKATFETIKNENIGAIAEGDSLVHIVTRTEMLVNGQPIYELNVASCRKVDGEWKVVLSPKVEGIAMMMRQSLPH